MPTERQTNIILESEFEFKPYNQTTMTLPNEIISAYDAGAADEKKKAQVLADALEKIQEWCKDSGLKNCNIGNKLHMAVYHSLHLAKNALTNYAGEKEAGK